MSQNNGEKQASRCCYQTRAGRFVYLIKYCDNGSTLNFKVILNFKVKGVLTRPLGQRKCRIDKEIRLELIWSRPMEFNRSQWWQYCLEVFVVCFVMNTYYGSSLFIMAFTGVSLTSTNTTFSSKTSWNCWNGYWKKKDREWDGWFTVRSLQSYILNIV